MNLNKDIKMKRLFVLTMLTCMIPLAVADHHKDVKSKEKKMNNPNHLLNFAECKEIKEGIGGILSMSGGIWKEIEKNPEDKKKWGEVIALSDLAANQSTVYDVWCKDMIHKRMKSRDKAKKEKKHKNHEKPDN